MTKRPTKHEIADYLASLTDSELEAVVSDARQADRLDSFLGQKQYTANEAAKILGFERVQTEQED